MGSINTSSGPEPAGNETVEPGSGFSDPFGARMNPVMFGALAPALATYTRLPETAMLSGSPPPEDTGAPTGWGTPLKPIRDTDI